MNNNKTCAICNKPVSKKYWPFCSKRCADMDLGRWLGEDYAIPTDKPAEPHEKPEKNGDE